MHMTDFAYDGPIFLVPLSPSYPSSPVVCVSDVFFGTIRYDKKIKKFKKIEFVLKCSKLIFNVHSQTWLL